eukprot:3884698-Pleurochrysis_carterae.AAC.1
MTALAAMKQEQAERVPKPLQPHQRWRRYARRASKLLQKTPCGSPRASPCGCEPRPAVAVAVGAAEKVNTLPALPSPASAPPQLLSFPVPLTSPAPLSLFALSWVPRAIAAALPTPSATKQNAAGLLMRAGVAATATFVALIVAAAVALFAP